MRPLPRGPEASGAPRRAGERGWRSTYIPVESRTLETRFPDVYAIGDVATVGVPKVGVFSEGAARVVAETIIARRTGGEPPEGFDGRGACYVEFGAGRVGRVDVDFLSGPKPTGTFTQPSPGSSPTSCISARAGALCWFDRSEPTRRA